MSDEEDNENYGEYDEEDDDNLEVTIRLGGIMRDFKIQFLFWVCYFIGATCSRKEKREKAKRLDSQEKKIWKR